LERDEVIALMQRIVGDSPTFNPSESDVLQIQAWKQWSAGRRMIAEVLNKFRSDDRITKKQDDAKRTKDEVASAKLAPTVGPQN